MNRSNTNKTVGLELAIASRFTKRIKRLVVWNLFILSVAVFAQCIKLYIDTSGKLESLNADLLNKVVAEIFVDHEESLPLIFSEAQQRIPYVERIFLTSEIESVSLFTKVTALETGKTPSQYLAVEISPRSVMLSEWPLVLNVVSLLVFAFVFTLFIVPFAEKVPHHLFLKPIERIVFLLRNKGELLSSNESFEILEFIQLSQALKEFVKREDEFTSQKELLARQSAIAATTQSLAHDVRKPFSMLKIVLEAVSDADNPNDSQEIAKASLPEVNQAMASVEGMIQDVMQIGNNSKPNQEVAAPEAVIDAAINELFRVFPEADVGIEYNLNHVHCLFIDTIRVGRVFSNILVNAVQAMNTKGKLWINSHEENGFVEFRLGNAGSCIPKDSLPKLFDAFFTSGKKGGTGLGLAIAQKVVNEHGGTIRCDSDQTEKYPSGYVEFILTLPVATDLSPKRNEPLPSHSRVIHEQLLKLKKKDSDSGNTDDLELERNIIKKLKALSSAIPPILIVDDEAVYRNSLAGLLRSFRGGESELAKIPIVFAKNAWEAIHMVNEHSPFLIIQDIDLGVGSKNGIDVIKDLRQKGYQGRICVHSNRFLFDDQKTAVDAGADSVLPKPMSRAHFFKLIASALPVEILSVS